MAVRRSSLAVGVAEGGDELAHVGARPSTRSRTWPVSPSRSSSSARWTVTGRRLALLGLPPARLLVERLAAHLHRRVGGRALHERRRSGSPAARRAPGRSARARRRGRRCPSASPAAPPRGRSWAAPAGSAARGWRGRPAPAAGRWRTGRACRRGPPSSPSAAPGAPAATTSCEVTPAGLSNRMTPRRGEAQRRAARRPARGSAPPARRAGARWRRRRPGGGRRRRAARAIDDTSTAPSVARRLTLRLAAAIVGQQLAHEHGDLGALHRAEVVDDALGVGLQRARLLEVGARERWPG